MNTNENITPANLKFLLVIIGIMAIPAINGADRLILFVAQSMDLSIKFIMILSFLFHGLIILLLMIVLIRVLTTSSHAISERFLSPKALKICGLSFLVLIIGGYVANMYIAQQVNQFSLSRATANNLKSVDLFQLTTYQTWLNFITGVLLVILFFTTLFIQKPKEKEL